MNIRIILAEDHKITREGLVNMLKGQPGMEVVGEAGNGREAIQLVIFSQSTYFYAAGSRVVSYIHE